MTFDARLPWPVLFAVAVAAVLVAALRQRAGRPGRATGRMLAMAALAVVIAADPAVAGGQVAGVRSDANVMFVVDTTGSMAAEDYDGRRPRLEGVRADIGALTRAFAGAHFSLVTFDSKSRMVVPWTTDVAALDSAVSLLRQERTMYAVGSHLGLPMATMARSLPRPLPSNDDAEHYDVVFYFSDGEQTADQDTTSFRTMRSSVSAGAVFGYGTPEGGRMLLYTGRTSSLEQYIVDDETGVEAVSYIDETSLAAIAGDLEVGYLHRTAPGGLDELAADIADGARRERGDARDGARHLYWLAALGLVALSLWQAAATWLELVDTRRALRRPTALRPRPTTVPAERRRPVMAWRRWAR